MTDEQISSMKHAMTIARCDLSFALMHPELISKSSLTGFGRERLEQSINMITKALEDDEEFKKMQERWASENASR